MREKEEGNGEDRVSGVRIEMPIEASLPTATPAL
jgi:hypothetical protein